MEFQFDKYLLILMRILAFVSVSPIISMKGIPSILKLGLSATFALFTYAGVPETLVLDSFLELGFIGVKEVLFGLAMGYVTNLIFSAMEMAGQLVDFQAGFSMSQTYDPIMGVNAGNYGSFYYWMGVCAFFILDLHHKVLETMIRSFQYAPIGEGAYIGVTAEAILTMFGRVFELAVNLAVPMIIVALVVDVVLGVVSRTIPQINVLMMGMPMKQLVSFLVMLVSISWLLSEMGEIVLLIPEYLNGLINLM